jgi:hypothetical protein
MLPMTTHTQHLKSPKSSQELIDMYFLDVRCALLEAAAFFDRLDRSTEDSASLANHPQVVQLKKACETLLDTSSTSKVQSILKQLSDDDSN